MKRSVIQRPKKAFSFPYRTLALALAAVLLAALTAADSVVAPLPEAILLAPSNEQFLAVEEQDGIVFLVTETGGGMNIRWLDSAQPQANPEALFWDKPPAMVWSAGGNLRFVWLNSGFPVLCTYVPGKAKEDIASDSSPFFVSVDEESLFAPSPDGDLMYIASPFGTLQIVDRENNELTPVQDEQGNYFENVEFLTVTGEGWYHMYRDGALYRWRDPLWQDLKTYSIAGVDRLVGEDYCVDGAGVLCRREEDGMQPMLEGEDLDFALCCQAGEGILAADTSGIVHKYTAEGQEEGVSGPVDGRILALVPSGAIVEKEGMYRFSPYAFMSGEEPDPGPTEEPGPTDPPGPTEPPPPEETPGPTDEPSPSPSDGPTLEELGVAYEGNYITMKAGVTVGDLVELFKPDSVLIQNAEGEPVTGGLMATDMKVDDYTVIVYGDCSGTGKVSLRDLYMVQSALVGEERFSTTAREKAADFTRDGSVDTQDLVALMLEMERSRE